MNHLRHLKPVLRSRTLALTVGASMLAVGGAAAAPGEPLPERATIEASEIAEGAPAAALPDAFPEQASDQARTALSSATAAREDIPEPVDGNSGPDGELTGSELDGEGADQRSEVANRVHAIHENPDDLEGSDFGHAVADAASDGRSTAGQDNAATARERDEDEVNGTTDSEGIVDDLDVPVGPPAETPVGPPEGTPPTDVPPTDVPPTDVPPIDTPAGPPVAAPNAS